MCNNDKPIVLLRTSRILIGKHWHTTHTHIYMSKGTQIPYLLLRWYHTDKRNTHANILCMNVHFDNTQATKHTCILPLQQCILCIRVWLFGHGLPHTHTWSQWLDQVLCMCDWLFVLSQPNTHTWSKILECMLVVCMWTHTLMQWYAQPSLLCYGIQLWTHNNIATRCWCLLDSYCFGQVP